MIALLKKWKKRMALCRAIRECSFQRVEALLNNGLDVNFVMGGSSPLSQAAWKLYGSIDCRSSADTERKVLDVLIAFGASANMPGNDSLLIAAALMGDHQLIDVALNGGQDLHFRPPSTPTPLQAAAFKNRTETMKYLISKGATKEDFNVQKCRWTSIHSETIRILLELGVDVPFDVAESVRNGKWISDLCDRVKS
jgi:ankyrin repeat protein